MIIFQSFTDTREGEQNPNNSPGINYPDLWRPNLEVRVRTYLLHVWPTSLPNWYINSFASNCVNNNNLICFVPDTV